MRAIQAKQADDEPKRTRFVNPTALIHVDFLLNLK
jgi:hypothetical protein